MSTYYYKHNHTATRLHMLGSLAAVVLGVSSCAPPFAGDDTPADGGTPVSFAAQSGWNNVTDGGNKAEDGTRLAEGTDGMAFERGDAIGVFAYKNDSSTPDFMNNQSVTFDGAASWTYAPVKYWPNDNTDQLSFFAYYPYRDISDSDTINASFSSNSRLKINYCCPNANIDLMASQPLWQQTMSNSNGKVHLNFLHLLARIQFSFTCEGADGYHPVIHVLKYTVPHYKGTAICNSNDNESPFAWEKTIADDFTQIVRYVSNPEGTILKGTNMVIPEFTSYILPGSFPYSPTADGNVGNFVISLNNKFYTYTPSSQITVEAGKSYIVNFKVTTDYGGTGNFFITSYSIWADGGTIEGTLE